MTNNQLLKKLSQDMKMRNFSHYTYDTYMSKTKELIKYFNKPLEEVTIEELRDFLYKHLLKERKLADRTINYYNSIIRFVYEVTLDILLNKKQIPMRKQKKTVYKVLTKEELSTFFNCIDNYKFKTIFMLAYGAGLRIGEIVNLRVEDIDSKTMRIFVREGKGNKERYTILPEETLKMLRIYWSKYRQNKRRGRIFLSESGEAITVGVIRTHFRKYRRRAKLNEKVTVHTLRHRFCNKFNRKWSKFNTSKRINGTQQYKKYDVLCTCSQYRFRIRKSIRYIFEGRKINMEQIQKILEIGLDDYNKKHKVIGYKQKSMNAIRNCKTGAIGAHKYVCDECGYEEIAYNSCRNRHCPNCQTGKKLKWIEARKEEVLNIKYYHIVFTIPSELYLIALHNQAKIYKILFKAAAETLQELAKDKKYLGGEIGFFSVLHTWGQNMMYHPHVHLVVTGGGLTETGKWVEKEEDFFIPVKVMSRKFRGKFLSYLRQEKLEFYGANEYLKIQENFDELIAKMYNSEWIVYCKEPFNNADSVIQYLGRYTHRVAISNERILNVTEETVTFKWRDYKDNNQMKEMTITTEEFIRRFLLHILPPYFMKIRYYGILGNRNKKKKLLKCKILTRTKIYKKKKLPALELLKQTLGKDFNLCPCCKKGHMLIPNTT